jgi:UDP:flavonoid glycosyltransferase YjiC (YdhE family)
MKLGFVSVPLTGHLNPMIALARKLKARGHDVVFLGFPDIGPIVRAAGLEFVNCAEKEYLAGTIDKLYGPVSKLSGLEVGVALVDPRDVYGPFSHRRRKACGKSCWRTMLKRW